MTRILAVKLDKNLLFTFPPAHLLTCSLLFVTILFLPHLAQAQETPSIQQLHIQVMPEFDDPRVLVIVQGRLAAESEAFPYSVTFYVPAEAQINQMATMDVATGQTAPQAYETSPHPTDPRWTAVTYTLDNAHFFYEFYYTPYATGADKQFTYAFNSPLPVDDLLVEIQKPRTAEAFSLEPAANISRVDNFGLTLYQFPLGALAAGKEAVIDITYTKDDPTPSVSREELMAVQAPGMADTAVTNPTFAPITNAQSQSAENMGAIALAVLGGVVAAAVFGRYLWLRRQSATQIPTLATAGPPRAKFCPYCGAALKSDSQFCHECGEAIT